MSSTDSGSYDLAARAIGRVLAAERAAADDIEAAQRAAAASLEQARERARRVSATATRRIARIRAAFADRTSAAVDGRDAEAAAIADPEVSAEWASALDAAIARLADELTAGR